MANFTLSEIKNKLARAHAGMAKVREQAEHATGIAINTVEIAGTAAVLSYMRGRYPSEIEKTVNGVKTKELTKDLLVAGIPVALLVGVAGHVAGFAGLLGKYSDHGHAIGTGGLAEYATAMMWKIGDDARLEAKKSGSAPKTAGMFASANRGQGQIGAGYPQPYAATYGGHMAGMF